MRTMFMWQITRWTMFVLRKDCYTGITCDHWLSEKMQLSSTYGKKRLKDTQ